MQIIFAPHFSITAKTASSLMRIEAVKAKVNHLPLTPSLLTSLRETARLYTTHYSTMIEGNALKPPQIEAVLKHKGHFPGRERDEREVKGYYAALTELEKWAKKGEVITEKNIQTLHALVMSDGTSKVKPSPYRDGQNVIRDGHSGKIVYMPPEAKDVSKMMEGLIKWISANKEIPSPIIASIAHYQFATIHPYYDGNGRTARLLTTLVLHLGGYDLKGLYSLEEYYARHLGAYYEAISVGPSHNYYLGRAEADISAWIDYFVEGMAIAFENVLKRMEEAKGEVSTDHTNLIRSLDPRMRKALALFQTSTTLTSKELCELFGFQARTAAKLCKEWVEAGFLEIVDSSNRGRKYKLAKPYDNLFKNL